MNAILDVKQIELHFEKANMAAEQVERNATLIVSIAISSGKALVDAKALVPHGEWSVWLGKHWNYSHRLANNYMEIANSQHAANLQDAKSIREALRIVAADADAPIEDRKTGRVKVIEPGQQSVQADATDPDPDPSPAKPTNRKASAATTKPKEADKPKTRPLVPEILADSPKQADPVADWLESHSLAEIVERLVGKIEDDKSKKTAAKQLRKLADKLDPPTRFVKPELEDVSSYFAELKAADPDSFFDFYESKGWLVGKVSMKDWRASARKWVRENATNGRSNSNGNGHGRSAATNSGGNSRPPVERAKITYK